VAFFIKLASKLDVKMGDLTIVRTAVIFILVNPFRFYFKQSLCDSIPQGKGKVLFIRSLVGVVGFSLGAAGLSYIPLRWPLLFLTLPRFGHLFLQCACSKNLCRKLK
jgi:hypothetical protein